MKCMSMNKLAGILLTVWKLVICMIVITSVVVFAGSVNNIMNGKILQTVVMLILYVAWITAILLWKRATWRIMRKAVEEWVAQNIQDWYGDN
jgi:ABC-type transport system involved in cytochrome bd biosynthesis fused ATPase/permease subunit